jgi:hypothetical protein
MGRGGAYVEGNACPTRDCGPTIAGPGAPSTAYCLLLTAYCKHGRLQCPSLEFGKHH